MVLNLCISPDNALYLYQVSRKYLKRVSELLRGCSLYTKCSKGHNYVNSVVKLWVLFCPYCLIVFYICTKFCQSISLGFRVTDLNSRVDARVVANVDGRTYGQTYGKPDPYIAPCLRQGRQKRLI